MNLPYQVFKILHKLYFVIKEFLCTKIMNVYIHPKKANQQKFEAAHLNFFLTIFVL